MSEDEGQVVLVDILVGGEIKQVLLPAELVAKATREADRNGTAVEVVMERVLVNHVFDGIVRKWFSSGR